MREQIRQIVVQAIAGTTDLTEAIDQLCVLSDTRENSVIKPKWINIKDKWPPKENRTFNYRIIFTEENGEGIPTPGLGFMYSKFDGNKFEENHWRLDIMKNYEDCPKITVLYWAELEKVELPNEIINN